MPALSFQIPPGTKPGDKEALLDNVGVCSGPAADTFPELTIRRIDDTTLSIRSEGTESCHVLAPWGIQGKGRVLLKTATLLPENSPFSLLVELARGKIHQIYSIVSDMRYRGLKIRETAPRLVEEATIALGKALCAPTSDACAVHSLEAIQLSSEAGDAFLDDYQSHLTAIKTQGGAKLDTLMSFTLRGRIPSPDQADLLLKAFSGVSISIPWSRLQPARGEWDWDPLDSALAWARSHGFTVTLGPIFTPETDLLPHWVLDSGVDVNSVAAHVSRFVEQLLNRYMSLGFVGRFNIINSANVANVGEFTEDEWLRLTWQALDTAKQVDGSHEITMGIRQPWGEIMAKEARDHNPANYLETLVRSIGNISSVELEVLTGSITGATHRRDNLDYYRLLEIFFGVCQKPIKMVLAMPSRNDLEAGIVNTDSCFTEAGQAEFMRRLGGIFTASPYVNEFRWHQTFDDDPGGVPGAGLFGPSGAPKAILEECIRLREAIIR